MTLKLVQVAEKNNEKATHLDHNDIVSINCYHTASNAKLNMIFISCFAAGTKSLPTRLTFEGIFSQTPSTSSASASKEKLPPNRRQSTLEDDADNSGNEDLEVIFTENRI